MASRIFSIIRRQLPARCYSTTKASPAAKRLQSLRLMTAIKTPFHPDGTIDIESYDRHCEHQIANGVEALVVGGTTGEGHLFSWEDHIMLIAHTKHTFGDKLVVVGNTGSNATGEAVHATKQGFAVGMDCSLQINPYYGKTSDSGIMRHINAGMDYGPAIIYNVPGRTAQDIQPEMMEEIAEHPNFVGIKECMGPERIKLYADKGMSVWSGNDDDCHYSRHQCGAMGSISVAANIVPGLYREMMFGEQNDELAKSLEPLFKFLFKEPNPIGVNTLLMMLGVCQPVFRLPYTNLDQGINILNEIGLQHCPNGGELRLIEDENEFIHCAEY